MQISAPIICRLLRELRQTITSNIALQINKIIMRRVKNLVIDVPSDEVENYNLAAQDN